MHNAYNFHDGQRSSEQAQKEFLLQQPVGAKAYLFSQAPPVVQSSNTESERDRRLRLRAQERANRQAGVPNSAYTNTTEMPPQVSLDAQRAELEERQRLLQLKRQEADELEERLHLQHVQPPPEPEPLYRADSQRQDRSRIQPEVAKNLQDSCCPARVALMMKNVGIAKS